MGWTAAQLPDLTGLSALVTGANSGIGWQTARQLAGHGARVVLACRDVEAGKHAADRIQSAVPAAQLDVVHLDLASMASVRAVGDQWTGPLDLLVNNAGVMAPPKRISTEDGYELQFGTNHLGHYVLTGLLLPSLLQADAPRVVTVASTAHFGGDADVLSANAGPDYNPQKTYSNSKLANLLFAFELQRLASAKGLPLVSTAAHPGVAATGLVGDPQGMGANRMIRTVAPFFLRVLTQSAAAGARPTLFAATEGEPGSYTGPQRLGESRGAIGPARTSTYARDERLARKLWLCSEDLTGLHYPWP
ncbi:MAG TPA: oxidoreductase [Jatrophihabitantaceae bacterium]|jgi:NAD(P)-dependent dehydrogenase (short-subunit alcohol dehydrogenase family)